MNRRISNLTTYNPHFFEEHSDTTEFEDYPSPSAENNTKPTLSYRTPSIYRRLPEMNGVNQQILRRNQLYSDMEHRGDQGVEYICRKKTLHTTVINPRKDIDIETNFAENSISFSRGDQSYIKATQRKGYVRKKMLKASLSNIFGRPKANFHQLSTIKESDTTARKDNSCQVYCVHRDNKPFEINTQMQVYRCDHSCEPNVYDKPMKDYTRYNSPKIKPYTNLNTQKSHTNQCLNYDESDVKNEIKIILSKKNDFKEKQPKRAETVKRAKRTETEKTSKRKCEQVYVSMKENGESPLKLVPESSTCPNNNCCGDDCLKYTNSSAFWDFIYDKLNKKFNQKCKTKPCPCIDKQNPPKEAKPMYCDCLTSDRQNNVVVKPVYMTSASQTATLTNLSYLNFTDNSQNIRYPTNDNRNYTQEKTRTVASQYNTPQPQIVSNIDKIRVYKKNNCKAHDVITNLGDDNFKGDVLCIHNPQCVVIKGSFTSHTEKVKPQLQTYDAFEDTFPTKLTNAGVYINENTKRIPSNVETQKPLMEERETGQIIAPKPPPHTVQDYYNYRDYEPIGNTFVDNSMCEERLSPKVKDKKCKNHKRKTNCNQMPKYTIVNEPLSDVHSVETLVKHKPKLECPHIPPCIMIPRCLGRMMCDGLIPYDALPDCSHQPTCERIPGCCRRAPKMISVYSQYPAPCRIV